MAVCAVCRHKLGKVAAAGSLCNIWLAGNKAADMSWWHKRLALSVCQDVLHMVLLSWSDHGAQVERHHERRTDSASANGKIFAACFALQLEQQIGDVRTLCLDMLSNLCIGDRQQQQQAARAWC